MSLKAYQSAARRAESPREVEYRLFADVTRALIDAAEAPEEALSVRIDAIDWNRRLWGALASDCRRDDNGLDPGVRAQIITLSLWVNRHSSAVMRRQEGFQPLIEVNRLIMQGLQPQPQPQAA